MIIRVHFHTFGTEFKQTTQTLKFTFTVFYYDALVIKGVENLKKVVNLLFHNNFSNFVFAVVQGSRKSSSQIPN